jgi:hypothetical protein
MNDPEMDAYLRRCVLAVAQMQQGNATFDELVTFHYAVGLSLMGTRSGHGTPIPQITKDGLDALHEAAHALEEATDFDLASYATATIAEIHLATSVALAGWGSDA